MDEVFALMEYHSTARRYAWIGCPQCITQTSRSFGHAQSTIGPFGNIYHSYVVQQFVPSLLGHQGLHCNMPGQHLYRSPFRAAKEMAQCRQQRYPIFHVRGSCRQHAGPPMLTVSREQVGVASFRLPMGSAACDGAGGWARCLPTAVRPWTG